MHRVILYRLYRLVAVVRRNGSVALRLQINFQSGYYIAFVVAN